MFIQDQSLIYKQYDSLYYGITKNNGKIILKHYYFKESYPEIKSFFFVNYEYDIYSFQQSENKNSTSLNVQNMELEYIVPLKLIESSILLFQYIFNYCINYKIQINNIWDQLSIFFKNDFSTERESDYFIYNLLYQLDILENEYSIENTDYKKIIFEVLTKINPNHKLHLSKILNITEKK